jgi:hypothetical protein
MLGRTQTKANAWAQRRPDQVVPVHFVGKDLVGPRVTLKRGTFWETQDKRPIRLWGEAYGVVDAETRPFHELPFPTFFPPPSTAEIRWVSFMGHRTQPPAFLPLSRRASAGSLLS